MCRLYDHHNKHIHRDGLFYYDHSNTAWSTARNGAHWIFGFLGLMESMGWEMSVF